MHSNGTIERRKHRRAGIHLEAILEGPTPEENVRITVVNFSAGGFFCRINREIEPLTRLGITFQFPPYAEHAPRMIETTAVVIRSDKAEQGGDDYRMAACFLALSDEDKKHITGYVDWYHLVYGEADATA